MILHEYVALTLASKQKLLDHTTFGFHALLKVAQLLWVQIHNTDVNNSPRNTWALAANR